MNDTTKTTAVDLEAKSRLAKLLATENITIVHRQVPTATFDSIKRVLTLPIWKDMSNELYNMLVGHEIGHALYTCKDLETYNRAVNAVDPTPANRANVKSFLNIVEDARIERLTQARFPGLRQDFRVAYKDIMDRDFFGIKTTPGGVNAMPFVDRLNVHGKVGISAGVKFNKAEEALVDRVNKAFTWDEMVAACRAVYDYSKLEQNGLPQPQDSQDEGDGEGSEGEGSDNDNSGQKSDAKPSDKNSDKPADKKNKKKADKKSDKKDKEKSDSDSSSDTGEDSDGESGSDSADDTDGQTDGNSDGESDGDSDGDSGDSEGDDSDGDSGDDADGDTDGDSDGDSEGDADGESGDSSDDNKTQGTGDIKSNTRGKGSKTPKKGDRSGNKAADNPAPPEARTQDNYDNNSNQLVNSGASDYVYLTMPETNLKNLIVTQDKIHANIRKFYGNPANYGTKSAISSSYYSTSNVRVDMIAEATKVWEQFRKVNDPVVNYMVKEFNMRKAADETRKAATSRTGDLDLTKLASYKFSDNIFKKVMVMPTGKNHGLVMFIDWSGSMSSMMGNMIEQLLTLVSFCRKVNIPFEVYGFGAETDYAPKEAFTFKEYDIAMDETFRLRQYFSAGMSANAFNQACINMMALALAFSGGWRAPGVNGFRYTAALPTGEGLGGTPLTETIVASYPIMKAFKEKNNLQYVHMVVLTDGDGNGCGGYMCNDLYGKPTRHQYFNTGNNVYILRDPITKKDYRMNAGLSCYSSDAVTEMVLTVIKARMNMNVIGFFIIPAGNRNNIVTTAMNKIGARSPRRSGRRTGYRNRRFITSQTAAAATNSKSETQLAMEKQFDENRYVSITVGGFDEYFIISGDSKTGKVQTGTLDIDPNASNRKITDAFIKQNLTTLKSRTLMGRFISLISKGKEN